MDGTSSAEEARAEEHGESPRSTLTKRRYQTRGGTTTNSRHAGMNGSVKATSLHLDDRHLNDELEDGRIISTPMQWYPELLTARVKQHAEYTFICWGTGIEWPLLDYQLNMESMLAATPQTKAP